MGNPTDRPADPGPRLRIDTIDHRTEAVALLLHGGTERSDHPVPWWSLAAARMIPIGWSIRRATSGVAVARLRYRHRGWAGTHADPVADARVALERLRAAAPGRPVVLVGHSMGGRVAVRIAGDPAVRGVVALAPWLPPGEPIHALADRHLVVIHGTSDRRTSPQYTAHFAQRAGAVARSVRYEPIPEGDHPMLRRFRRWHDRISHAVAVIVRATVVTGPGP